MVQMLNDLKFLSSSYGFLLLIITIPVFVYFIFWLLINLICLKSSFLNIYNNIRVQISLLTSLLHFDFFDFTKLPNLILLLFVGLAFYVGIGLFAIKYNLSLNLALEVLGLLIFIFGYVIAQPINSFYNSRKLNKNFKYGERYCYYFKKGHPIVYLISKYCRAEHGYMRFNDCTLKIHKEYVDEKINKMKLFIGQMKIQHSDDRYVIIQTNEFKIPEETIKNSSWFVFEDVKVSEFYHPTPNDKVIDINNDSVIYSTIKNKQNKHKIFNIQNIM